MRTDLATCLLWITASCNWPAPALGEGSSPIVSGAEIDDGADPAVVYLAVGQASCTGSLISCRLVLTAAHCVAGLGADEIQAYFGHDPKGDGPWIPATAVDTHPTADVAIVTLAAAGPAPPVPLLDTSLPGLEGRPVRIVGFGATNDVGAGVGAKRCGVTALERLEGEYLVTGYAGAGTCLGDSGGPNLIVVDGRERLAGVTSYGTGPCGEPADFAVRVDALRPWIDERLAGDRSDGCPSASLDESIPDCALPDPLQTTPTPPPPPGCAVAPGPGRGDLAGWAATIFLVLLQAARCTRRHACEAGRAPSQRSRWVLASARAVLGARRGGEPMIRNALKFAGVIALTIFAACLEEGLGPEPGPQHEEVNVEELLCAQSNARSDGSADDSTADSGTSHNSQGGTSSGSSAGFADGHAWLAHVIVYQDGASKIARATTYGAWPDSHPLIAQLGLANGAGSDVRRNMEGSYAGRSIAYCVRMDATMKAAWVTARDAAWDWGYVANCGSWAYNKFKDATGEVVDPSDYLWISTPRMFGTAIYNKNGNNNDGLLREIGRRSAHTITTFEVTGGIFPIGGGRSRVVNVGNGREHPCGGKEISYDVTDVDDYLSPEYWLNNTDLCDATIDPSMDCGCHVPGLDDDTDIGCPQECPTDPCGPFSGPDGIGGLDHLP